MDSGVAHGLALTHPVIVLVGPTASGKTDVAQLVGRAIGGEVVSADSMQIYRGMDIGTGKIAPSDRIVVHHGLDIVEPGQPYSASLFQAYARACFAEAEERGSRCILAGGTGFYVRAAIDDYRFPQGEQSDNPVREKWNRFLEEQGSAALWDRLRQVDPESAALIHPNNSKRVVRALEMLEMDGVSYAKQHEGLASLAQFVPARFYGLSVDPDILRVRIDGRVDHMVDEGLVDEVRSLLDAGFKEACTAKEAIGYKEVVAYLEGACSFEEAVEAIKAATRRYAKRQRTWWRGDARVRWIDANDGDVVRIAAEIVDDVRRNESAC